MNPPPLSIIIPTLNEAKTLPHLLQDLAGQTDLDYEVIIVDAHSKDHTADVARRFTSTIPRFRLIDTPQKNVSNQRNLGAGHAKGDYLLFLDADDRIPPYFLQGLNYHITVNHPDIFSTLMAPDSDSGKDAIIIKAVNLYMELQQHTSNASAMEAMLGFKTAVFTKLPGFDPNIPWGEGGDLIKRAINQGYRFCLFKDPQYQYSLRRLRLDGTLNFAAKTAQLELARILNRPITGTKAKKLYPMKGGAYFNQATKSKSGIVKIISELKNFNLTPKAKN